MLELLAGKQINLKSRWIYRRISERVSEDPHQKQVLIVPEQFTLQAEKAFLEATGAFGLLNPEVLSFNRMAYRVFHETGGRNRIVIDELGKHMIIRKIIQDSADRLLLYSGLARERGFIDKIVDSITECKQYEITADQLKDQAGWFEADSLTRKKLLDLALIFEEFEIRLKDHYVDREDQFRALIDQMNQSMVISRTEFWIDGFFSYTPHMLNVIKALCEHAPAVHIAAYGSIEELNHTDEPLLRQYQALISGLQQAGGRVMLEDIDQLTGAVTQNETLAHIRKAFNVLPAAEFNQKPEGLSLFRAANDDAEIERVAAEIMTYVQEKNSRFREISVLCADLDQRADGLARIFRRYGIPFFIDSKRKINEHPLIQLILSVLETLRQGYSYQAVFRCIKTGYTGLSQDEVEKLENFVLARGIRGMLWKKDFFGQRDEKDLADLNALRKRFMEPLNALEKELRDGHSVRIMTQALLSWLKTIRIDEQLSHEVNHHKEHHDFEAAAMTAQLWNRLMDLMDQLVEMMGESPVSLRDYQQLWQAGLESMEIGLIPSTLDQVMVGTPERSRQTGIKALFLIGVNDGVLPGTPAETGLLLNLEKAELQKNGCLLGMPAETRQAYEELYIFLSLTRPSEFLWVSCSQATIEGDARRPSILIERIRKMFPMLTEQSDLLNTDFETNLLRSPGTSFRLLAAKLREYADGDEISTKWMTLFKWFSSQQEWKGETEKLLAALNYRNQPEDLKKMQVTKLFGANYRGSVSRLEKYNQCPFAHFIRYGLKPQKRKLNEIDPPDLGTLLHHVMDQFGHELQRQVEDCEIDTEHLHTIADRVVGELVDQFKSGIFKSSARFNYQGERLKRISLRAMKTMLFHLRNSGFKPFAYEMKFGRSDQDDESAVFEIRADDGTIVSLQGRIDRLDLLLDEGCCYYRIIDYKSGNTHFSMTEAVYGLQLQLLVYLLAAMEQQIEPVMGLEKKPAGLFYFYLDDPMIEMDRQDETAAAREIRKALKLNGLVLRDMKIIREMDRSMEQHSEIIPVSLTKSGDYAKNSSTIAAADFDILQTFVKSSVCNTARSIMKGIIRAEPAELGTWKACEYCDYPGICQYDESFPGNMPRKLFRMDDAEALEQMLKICAVKKEETQ
jgi:ATP-dependent helicase/nuclease subunit B